MNKGKNIFFLFLLALGLGNIFANYISGSPIQSYLFNSDALYLPTLFSDIFANDGQIKDWFLTPAPYFFPDYPMFFLAYLVGATPYSQIIAFALIQTALTFFAIWFVARTATKINSFLTASTALLILIWLALTTMDSYSPLSVGEPFVYILNSAFHYGAFLSSILLSALWIKINNEDKNNKTIAIFLLMAIIAYATTLSDNLFLVQFIAPLIAVQILTAAAERDFSFKNKIPPILIAICGLLGSMSYKWIVENQTRHLTVIGLDKLSSNLKDIYNILHLAIIGNPAFGLIFLLYIGIVLRSFIQLMRGEKEGSGLSWLAIFSFLSFCATIGAFSLVSNLPIPIQGRYLIPALSWPVIVVLIFLSGRLRDRFFYLAIAISLPALAFMNWSSYHSIMSNGIEKQYYPEEISCIDNALEKENLHNGIAQYWDAKHLQNFSRLNLNIAQHSGDLVEYYWITSKKYFKPSYDFAIISEDAAPAYKISSDLLTRINGVPKFVKSCGSKSVLIYGKDKMRVRKIVAVGNSYVWKACELHTIIGEKTTGCEMQKKDNTQSGYVTFGPYERLPTGQYTFEIAYSSAANKGEIVGDWDVALALPSEVKVLKNGPITGTDRATAKVVGNFALDSGQDLEKVEIRTLARPNVDLKVITLRVDRVR